MLRRARCVFFRLCNSLLLRFLKEDRGVAAIEAALALPLVLMAGLFCVDLYKLGLERTRMEQAAGATAITLSVQQKLGAHGLDGLYAATFRGNGGKDERDRYQMLVTNVSMPSGRIWWTVLRGNEGVCENVQREGIYTGRLPKDTRSGVGGHPEDDSYSLIVLQLCRTVNDISLDYLPLPGRLEVVSTNRALAAKVDLDAALLAEAAGAIVQEKRKQK